MIDDGDKKNGNNDDDAIFGDDEFGELEDFEDEFWEDDEDLDSDSSSDEAAAADVGPDPFTSFEDFEDEDDDGQSGEYAFNMPPKKKTFLQKYFSVIVGLIVLLFGGLWFMAQDFGSGSSAPQQVADTGELPSQDGALPLENDVPDIAQAGDLPPQPAPFQTDPMAEPDMEPALDDGMVPAPPEALTPLPGSDSSAIEPTELADLDDVLNQNPMDVRTAAPPTDIDAEALAPSVPAPDPFPAEPLVQAELDAEPMPMRSDDEIDDNLDSLEVDAQPASEPMPEPEDMSIDMTDEPAPASAPAVQEQDTELAQQNEALLEEIEANRMALENLRQELKTVQMRLETSKEELKLAEEETAQAPVVIEKIVDSAPEPEPEPVAEVKAPEPKKVVSKPKVKAAPKPVEWTIRSASPGRATISQKGTNDFLNVEVGSKVAGLGSIQSIQIENGKWVVRGSTGSVSR